MYEKEIYAMLQNLKDRKYSVSVLEVNSKFSGIISNGRTMFSIKSNKIDFLSPEVMGNGKNFFLIEDQNICKEIYSVLENSEPKLYKQIMESV